MPNPTLFTPITLRNLTIRNRVWVPPMCMYSALGKDGIPTAFHTAHYGAMALGGAGLIIVEATAVNPEGRISFHDLGIWNDEQVAAFTPITSFMSAQGVVPGIQLAHAGRKASTYPGWGYDGIDGTVPVEEGGWKPLGPSANAFTGYAQAEAMSEAQIAQVITDFAAAARRAVEAGFQVLEIHAAHGYLIHEFLSPLSNERTDDFGGSPENNIRIAKLVGEKVRAAIGPDKLLVLRLSQDGVDDFVGAWPGTDYAKAIGAALKGSAYDALHWSSYNNHENRKDDDSTPMTVVLRAAAGLPMITNGGIAEEPQTETPLTRRAAEKLAVGRGK